MLRKFLIIFMCLALICPSVFAEDSEDNYFVAAEYHKEALFLQSLGILAEEDAFLDTDEWSISRGEFVHLAISAMGFDEMAAALSLECPFRDINEENEFFKDIAFANQYKILGKHPGLVIKPDEPLTVEFAARVGVCMTGREFMVSGGTSYANVAQTSKLFKNVEFYDGDKISRGEAMKFIINVLNTEVGSVYSISSKGNMEFYIEEGETLLNRCFNIERCEGILTSDGITTVFGEKARPGYATINGESYRMLCTDYYGLAGQWVEFYIKNEKNEASKIQSIEAKNNSILTLDTDSIDKFDSATLQYTAYVDNRQKSLKISSDALVAYNFEPDFEPARMKPAKGSVKLIDHKGDGIFDSVLIYEFTNTVVKNYNDYSQMLYDVSDSNYDIDLENYDSFTIVDVRNVPIAPGEILKNNVVSLYENPNHNTARLVVSSNSKRGKLTKVDMNSGIFEFDDAVYKLSQSVRFKESSLSVGNNYQVFLDAMGEIAYIKGDDGMVAYLVTGKKDGIFETIVTLRLLDEDTKGIKDIDLAKKVTVVRPNVANDSLNAETLYDTLICPGGSFVRQMVMFKTNSKGQINKMIFPMEIDDYDKLFTADSYPLYYLSYMIKQFPKFAGGVYNTDGTLNEESSKFTYYSSGDAANRWLLVGNNTLGFYVPNTPVINYESVAVKSVTFSDKEAIGLNEMRFYTDDLNSITAPYIVVQKAAQDKGYEGMYPSMISSICMVYDENIGATYQLTLNSCHGGEQSVLLLKDPELLFTDNFINKDAVISAVDASGNAINKTKLEVGDMIRYNRDAEGRISGIYLTWCNDANANSERYGVLIGGVPTNNATSNAIYPGIVKRVSDDIVELTVDGGTGSSSTERLQRIRWGKSSYILDMSGRGDAVFTKNSSATELVPGDRIFILSETGARTYGTWVYRK